MELSELIQTVAAYADHTDHTNFAEMEIMLTRAYQIASTVHQGFQRINGEPFLNHVLAVAAILAEWHAPPHVVTAGLLHDISNPDYSHGYNCGDLEDTLGLDITNIVRVVVELNSFIRHVEAGEFYREADTRNFRYTIATFLQREYNAVVIKMADRLHNLRTTSVLARAYQTRAASAVQNLFVPLAERLSMNITKRQLEDCCFEINNVTYYHQLRQHCANEAFRRSVEGVLEDLRQVAATTMPGKQIRWQPASLYETGQHVKLGKSMHIGSRALRLADAGSFIILTQDDSDCYRILGIIHKQYAPVVGQFHDHIGNPKENSYRALHTQVMHTSGNLIQISIRTSTMDLIAEHGMTARWWNVSEKLLPQLPVEVEHVNGDMKVFTPKDEAKYLPHGATVLDFAYHVHTDVGNHCVGALVNGTHAEPYKMLQAGDKIEIIAGNAQSEPVLDWLDYVQTPQAASRIRQWLTQHKREAMLERGRLLLSSELQPLGMDLTDVQVQMSLAKIAAKEKLESAEDLLVSIGVERHAPTKIADTLKTMRLKSMSSSGYIEPMIGVDVLSSGDAQLSRVFARCCGPQPPDDIVGYRRNDGILTIHRRTCGQVKELEKLVQVKWGTAQAEANYVIVVEALNHPGLASEISSVVTMLGIDMQSFNARKQLDGVKAEVHIYLGKTTAAQRNRIKNALEGKPRVTNVEIIHSTFLSVPSQPTTFSRTAYLANPYGPWLAEGSRFYGRETEYERIAALLRNQSQSIAILLWGQRRIGKTSFVLRLQKQAQGDYLPVYIDVQGRKDSSTTQFLQELMSSIVKTLQDNTPSVGQKLSVPNLNRLKRDPLGHFDTFMGRLRAVTPQYPLVIILDEFQCLCSLREETVSLSAIISRLRSHSQHGRSMHFILSGGGLMSQLTGQCGIDSLFNITYNEKLGRLEENAVRRLIKDGLSKVGNISDLAIDLLVSFTSGHPFYLQLLCSRLFEQAQESEMKITQHFVSQSIHAWIVQTDSSRFQHFWEGHDAASARRNKLVLSAIAERGANTLGMEYEDLAKAIYPIVSEQTLLQVLGDLTSLGILKRHHFSYTIEVNLLVRWLRHHWPLELALQEARWQ